MEPFEYAVRKDIRNNPIVRQIDEARQRELWRSAAIGVVLVGVLLFYAWQHFELLRSGYRIETMQQELLAQRAVNRHLRLEIETLRAPARIEQMAIEHLGLIPPARHDAVVIERVEPPRPPGSGVVARSKVNERESRVNP